jgi:hypothetical protein
MLEMKRLRITCHIFLLVICLPITVCAVDEGLTVEAKINGREGRFAFDTGARTTLTLLKPTASKLLLKTTEKGGTATATIKLEIGGEQYGNVEATLVGFLPFQDIDGRIQDIDGLIGWPALRGQVWQVQWDNMSLSRIPSVPKETLSWRALEIDNAVPVAAVFFQEGREGRIYLDTGYPGGIMLSESRWNKWVEEEPELPKTLTFGYSLAAGGIFVTELRWSGNFRLGPLTIPRVMVEKNVLRWPKLEAVLGLEALKHFEIVFDLKENRIYMKERPYSRVNFKYNRLGATFPPESLESTRLVGHVLMNSPAYKAGLRSGDILLKVDDIDMTQWRTNPTILKKDFWAASVGTRYKLHIERNGRKQIITVTLVDILGIQNNENQKHNKRISADQ